MFEWPQKTTVWVHPFSLLSSNLSLQESKSSIFSSNLITSKGTSSSHCSAFVKPATVSSPLRLSSHPDNLALPCYLTLHNHIQGFRSPVGMHPPLTQNSKLLMHLAHNLASKRTLSQKLRQFKYIKNMSWASPPPFRVCPQTLSTVLLTENLPLIESVLEPSSSTINLKTLGPFCHPDKQSIFSSFLFYCYYQANPGG